MIKWTGTKELNSALKRINANFPSERDKFLRQIAEKVRARVVKKTPVDTGNLRLNWKCSNPSGGVVDVYNNVEYAPYVEFGHRIVAFGKDTGRVQPGVYMLKDAIDESRENFVADAGKILENLFK